MIKKQKCGKKNCICTKPNSQGITKPHGEYYWLVTYTGYIEGKSKYHWAFLGKSQKQAIKTLQASKPELLELSSDKSIQKIQEKLDYKPLVTLTNTQSKPVIKIS